MTDKWSNWVISMNNPNDEWAEKLEHFLVDHVTVRYLVGQWEVGEEGTEHWQGYVQFYNKQRASAVQNLFPGAWHKQASGTHVENTHYATKPQEHCSCKHCVKARQLPNKGRAYGHEQTRIGEPVGAEGAKQWKDVWQDIKDGYTDLELADKYEGLWAHAHKAMERYRLLTSARERTWMTKTHVLYGPPGTGKTRKALELAGANAYWVTYGTNVGAPQYYDGYDGQKVVVFDEFFGQIRRQEMCKLADEYPCNVPVRGGCVPWLPELIIITSNCHPDAWWARMGLGAMARRLAAPRGSVTLMDHVWEVRLEAPDEDLDDIEDGGMTLCLMCGQQRADCQCEGLPVHMVANEDGEFPHVPEVAMN